jgi:ubiquinone/menaquinone biosynthesis C-methylase UbiE
MDDNPHTRSGSYTYRDCPAVTELHATRTAASMAGFFLAHLRPGMRVLDCGCGPGSITVGLAEHVAPGEVIGIDLDPTHIALAQTRAADAGLSNVRFERADIYTLPFPKAEFDAVFCHSILSHLREPAQALREIRRILQPEGILGAREVDTEGMLIAPFAPILLQVRDLWEQVVRHNGGDTRIGKQLSALVRQAGFTQLAVSASYECFGASGPPRRATPFQMLEHWQMILEQSVQLGWISQDTSAQIETAWQGWGKHPDAFLAVPRWEVVGWSRDGSLIEGEKR